MRRRRYGEPLEAGGQGMDDAVDASRLEGADDGQDAAPHVTFHHDQVSLTMPPSRSLVSDPLDKYGDVEALSEALMAVLREPVLLDPHLYGVLKSFHVLEESEEAFKMIKIFDGLKMRAAGLGHLDGSDVVSADQIARARADGEITVRESSGANGIFFRFVEKPLRLEAWAEVGSARLAGEGLAKMFTKRFLEALPQEAQRMSLQRTSKEATKRTTLFASAAVAEVMLGPSSVSAAWLQFEFDVVRDITSVQTKQYPEEEQWLDSFTLSYSEDAEHWTSHDITFRGTEARTLEEVAVEPKIVAKYVRLHPQAWRIPKRETATFTWKDGLLPPPYVSQEAMTIEEAMERCRNRPGTLLGFTFEGERTTVGPVMVNFSNSPQRVQPGEAGSGCFTSCLCEHSRVSRLTHIEGFTLFSGYLQAGNDITKEELTVEEAKVRCVELEGCCGFTFQGDFDTQGPVLAYFKRSSLVGERGAHTGCITCLCDSSSRHRPALMRPTPTPSANIMRLNALENARPTECMTLSYVFDRPLDAVRLRASLERVVSMCPFIAGRLHRSKPLWKWEVRFDGEVGCPFYTRVLHPSLESELLKLDSDAIARGYKTLQQLSTSALQTGNGDVQKMERGAAPLCYVTLSLGLRASVITMSLSKKIADEWSIYALIRCWEQEFRNPGSSEPLVRPEEKGEEKGVHARTVAPSSSGRARVVYTLQQHTPPSKGRAGRLVSRLRELLLFGRFYCPYRRRPTSDVGARHVVAVKVTREALTEIQAGSAASLAAALSAWIGNAVNARCLRVSSQYRGHTDALPPTYFGSATGLQDYVPTWGAGCCSSRELDLALADLSNNFLYAQAPLPECADTVLCLQDLQHFATFDAQLLASLPPLSWESLDDVGTHRLFCSVPGDYVLTHTLQSEGAALKLQAAWGRLGQAACVFQV